MSKFPRAYGTSGVVISLQQLLSKEDRFFHLFEASATECCTCVKALRKLTLDPGNHQLLNAVTQARQRDKLIHNDITEALCSTVLASLEREDMMDLAEALYKIPKAAEKIGERILMAPALLAGFDLSQQTHMLQQATDTLRIMLEAMHHHSPIEEIKRLNSQLQEVEGKADKVVMELLSVLYQSDMHGRRVVFLKDIFELFEKITDRCRDAGNVIVQVTLKAA